jgi:hypothetical protein
MLEDASDEAPVIADEVRRLLALFQDNHSFNGYASQLLGAAAFKYALPVGWPALTLRKTSWQLPLDLRVCLGRAIAAGQPLTADQSLAWYGDHPDKKLPPQAARCPKEFLALYAARFKSQYPPKRRLTGDYRAASSTFTVQVSNKGTPIPDVAGIVAPLNVIEPLITACAEELASYARFARKDSSARNAMAAAIALPTQLLNAPSARPIVELKAWLDQQVGYTPKLFSTHDLLGKIDGGIAAEHRIGKSALSLLAAALDRCGYGLEPDPANGSFADRRGGVSVHITSSTNPSSAVLGCIGVCRHRDAGCDREWWRVRRRTGDIASASCRKSRLA